ncbi:hypothetical protein EST38_g1546 [Candolleomyces aberdarensis]|uniref:AAA+ ATPase domain-containing protein n=1 Tax=Candolleomyces aberdarensis TaxID=2316362 RepID=A0A4Q2DX96_9AGAR|nr:hypothetical protein EST38_g1546 [Candolleomyces aberdarensis]
MLPPVFVERFLWTPQPPTIAGDDSLGATPLKDGEVTLPVFRFTGSVQSELNSLTALAFSKAEKSRSASESVSDVPSEKCLVLSCPTKEGAHIIDAAVRHVANKQGADVVVLDALELAAGKLGLLGKEGQVLDEIYASAVAGSTSSDTAESTAAEESKPEDTKPPLSERSRALIDALLRLPTPSTENPEEEPQQPARRIIYFRDFQYILETAKPLVTHILQSLHESRVEASSRPTTILVFGSTNDSESLKINNAPTSTQENCLFLSSLFTHTPSLEPIPFNADWGKKVDELSTEKLSISVFAANVKSGASDEEWQKASKVKKIRRVNQLLLRACLEKEGCPIEGDWSEGSFDKVLEDQSDAQLEVENANSIVTITMGLVADASSSSTPSPDSESTDASPSPPKLIDLVSEAYRNFERRKKERSEWEKGNDPTQEEEGKKSGAEESDDDKKEETEKKPPKDTYDDVEGAARDLLGCIIDAGTHFSPVRISHNIYIFGIPLDEIPTTFTDVFVEGGIVDSLKTIVTLPLLYPQYFNTGVLAKEAIGGILLYGPPGTGKTMLCRALAKSSRAKMLHIKPSDINRKWLGQSEKQVTAVFELAHRLAPCIIFIDEIDSLFSSRNDCTKSWERNILTEFMQGMDGLRSAKKNKENNVVIVGATNRPFDLDLAVLRRMPRRILVDMPNLPTRKAILQSYLQDETLHEDIDLDKLAAQTDGFSGSDLKNLCVAAALSSVKEAIGPDWRNFDSETTTKTSAPSTASPSTNDSSSTEEQPDATSAEADAATKEKPEEQDDKDKKDKSPPELPLRTITPANIAQARNEISRSTFGNKRGDELYKWHEKYSTDGNTTTATDKGINGTTSNTGIGAGFYSSKSGLGKPGLNGHWNRWAKGGVQGTEPTVITAPAPGTKGE